MFGGERSNFWAFYLQLCGGKKVAYRVMRGGGLIRILTIEFNQTVRVIG